MSSTRRQKARPKKLMSLPSCVCVYLHSNNLLDHNGPTTNGPTTTDRTQRTNRHGPTATDPQRVFLCFLAAQKAAKGEAIPQKEKQAKKFRLKDKPQQASHEDGTTEKLGSKDRQQHQKVSAYVFSL